MPNLDGTENRLPPVSGVANTDGNSQRGGASAKVAVQVRRQASRLFDQGLVKVNQVAETGKDQAAAKLDDVASVLTSIAGTARDQYGPSVGDYIEKASGFVRSGAEGLRGRTIHGLATDTRVFLAKNAGAAIGTAAVFGFTAARIAKGGLNDDLPPAVPENSPTRPVVAYEGALA
ncbi:MAG TPA: hypothetical protein VF638_13875 [Sphingomonas sp.]|jgi:hypothetical protein